MMVQEKEVTGFESVTVEAMTPKPEISLSKKMRTLRRRRQKGMTIIEATIVLMLVALVVLAVYKATPYARNMVQANSFKNEASIMHTGVLNATETDADFSGETLATLVQNHAFDAAGSRVSSDHTSVQGMFGGQITASVGQVVNSNDAIVTGYPVPSAICSMTIGALSTIYAQVDVGSTTVFSPTVPFNSQAGASACQVAGSSVVTLKLYTTRS